MTTTNSCGTQLMHLLSAHGVDTIFGMPGVHTLEAYRGIEAAGIRHIGVRHEQGAGFMADGYARVSSAAPASPMPPRPSARPIPIPSPC
jgi:5-guanidino-2-oxopentanoate decarboxylase